MKVHDHGRDIECTVEEYKELFPSTLKIEELVEGLMLKQIPETVNKLKITVTPLGHIIKPHHIIQQQKACKQLQEDTEQLAKAYMFKGTKFDKGKFISQRAQYYINTGVPRKEADKKAVDDCKALMKFRKTGK